jgi:phenylpyruvate tautomerase PptA (4-oxalocrotonate tautomerase family)
MPLVRIDVYRGRPPETLKALADTVHEVIRDTFAAPAGDRYQIIHQHRPEELIIEDTGLGLARTTNTIVIQITHQGRSLQQKEHLYAALADRLAERDLVAPSDLVICLVENQREDWSFGMGRAQFLTGEL